MQKTRKIEKVTASQDDDFVGGLNTTGSICRKHEKIEKVTGSQDDDFVGVSKASGRGHLPSFIHTTRKLVVTEIAAGQQKQPDFVQRCSAQSSQQVTSSKSLLFR
jgi:hypothetical protein